ncbi:hypothetical protein KIN20_019500 [Parelaphostrongylus tenuis]|uniref:Uncharacterized protein n=1 Tax=Parelaphostrongylus tenuis TaxID=148309 RepID=A0AAD5QQ84_PARTN|nr:hypothetical protein KIN20_019500 [Parelaphostrongylus tenuis]
MVHGTTDCSAQNCNRIRGACGIQSDLLGYKSIVLGNYERVSQAKRIISSTSYYRLDLTHRFLVMVPTIHVDQPHCVLHGRDVCLTQIRKDRSKIWPEITCD